LNGFKTIHGFNGFRTDITDKKYPHKSALDPYQSVKEYPYESVLDQHKSVKENPRASEN